MMKCLKCAVLFFNLICFLCALILILLGSWIQINFVQYGKELQTVWQAATIFMITLGAFMLLLSLVGCFGALVGSVGVLWAYGALVVVLLIVESAAAIVTILWRDKLDPQVHGILKDAVYNYTQSDVIQPIDMIQKAFECCGADSADDYKHSSIPDSCGHFKVGCAPIFSEFLKSRLFVIACALFGVCFVQLLSIIIAFCLCRRLRGYGSV